MMKFKSIYILAFCSFFAFGVGTAEAGVPKFGIPDAVAKALENVSKVVDKLGEKFKNIERMVNESRIGKGITEIKAFRDKAKERYDSATAFVDEKVGGVKDKVDNAKSVVEEKTAGVTDKVDEAKDKVGAQTGTVSDLAAKAGLDGKATKELADLEYKRGLITAEYKAKIEASNSVYDGKVKLLDSNIEEINKRLSGDKG